MALELEAELDRLYGLPPGEFVQARNDLSKRARDEGERALAAEIKELRKPSVSTYVVNRLTRENELDMQRLLRAGERLTKAQLDAVAGRDQAAFRQARRDEHDALTRLTKAARKLLDRDGHGISALDKITQTLRTAATSQEGRELLRQGRLTGDLQPTGFEAFAGLSGDVEQKPGQAGDRRPDQRRRVNQAREVLREAKKQHRERVEAADAAEREARQAQRRADELAAAAERAVADAAAADQAVDEAEAALRDLKGT